MMKSARTRHLLLALAMVAVTTLIAPTAEAAATRHITITADGTVKVTPDAVRIAATVTHVSPTSKDALAAVAKVATAVRAALKSAQVDAKDISSQNVTVYPEYKYGTDGSSTITGYRASQSFSIVVRQAASAGSIVDALAVAGGDDLQINSTTPFILDANKSALAARTAAVKNAKVKAASYAKLLGVKLGKVNSLVENSSPQISIPMYATAKAESDATVVDLGVQNVTVSVTIDWALL